MTVFWKETNPAIKRDLDQTFKHVARDIVTYSSLKDPLMHRTYIGENSINHIVCCNYSVRVRNPALAGSLF